VLPFGMKDNFWEMGATGPCGPCTEIHYDRIGNRFVPERVNADLPDLVEIWNLVFIQFNREPDSSLRLLPAKSVDTGMGFERLTSVLQDVDSNYDTDVFKGIFDAIQEICQCSEYKRRVGKDDPDFFDMAYRVVADHIRTLTFAITDGAAPGPQGRDYVLRRVCRRAVVYGREKLGAGKDKQPFLYKLVPAVVQGFGDAFPELKKEGNFEKVQKIIKDEEILFNKTLQNGIKTFKKAASNLKEGDTLNGAICANLLTTYGFPIDLTTLMAEEKGILIDEDGFKQAMKVHSEVSKKTSDSGGMKLKLEAEQVAIIKQKNIAVTDDSAKYEWTSTGSGPKCKASVKAIYLGKADFEEKAGTGTTCGLLLDSTNFYAEQGGQIYDVGTITTPSGVFTVEDCQVAAGYVLHIGKVTSGSMSVGQACEATVDYARRSLIAKNHTATHLLNFALREVLKKDVDQKGSLVQPNRFRFDFSSDKGMKVKQIATVEGLVAKQVESKYEVYRRPTQLDDAKKINGLRAVFGEKYPDPVTVVSVGADVEQILKEPDSNKWTNFSIEFCGGTHVKNSKEIENFVIVSESSIAAGIRRIEALTGPAASKSLKLGKEVKSTVESFGKYNDMVKITEAVSIIDEKLAKKKGGDEGGEELPYDVRDWLQQQREMLMAKRKKLHKAGGDQAKGASLDAAKQLAEEINKSESKFAVAKLDAQGNVSIMNAAITAFQKISPGVPFMCLSEVKAGGKMAAIAVVPKELATKLSAKVWLSETLKQCGGKGGGRDFRAQGASKDSTNIAAAIEFARKMAQESLK